METDSAMATTTEPALPSTRTRPEPAPAILSKADGIFAGFILLIIGALWFLNTVEIINLGPKFGELVLPFLLIMAGLYLLVVKMVRR
jgi:hypothetical protein